MQVKFISFLLLHPWLRECGGTAIFVPNIPLEEPQFS